ncbi:MAG: hypothetical protein KatS3mg055_1669 [Chloroflexus sp.]|uniref:hypothetical protein n=1 Tax=Chloroflexus sp. TaxID=1904827 RepID=UPI0021DDC567|nr:hypothetical protein [Chloroflexus sp.]GIV89151.1 MAG: hypothetical protein KatS3mg055_1669 [Chloroflexus sp.]
MLGTIPLLRNIGRNVLAKLYVSTYQMVLKTGITLGKDLILLYSDYGIELPNSKSDFVYSEIQRSIEIVRSRLGVSEVPIE